MLELDERYCGKFIGSDELEDELVQQGYKVESIHVCSNNNGYFVLLRVEKDGEVCYLAVDSLSGEPMCVGTVEVSIN